MHFSFLMKQRNQNRLIVRNGEEKEGERETTRTQMMRRMRMLMTRIQRVVWTRMRTSRETGRRGPSSGR